jgi:tetraacyldisaccharide 4'-kinase
MTRGWSTLAQRLVFGASALRRHAYAAGWLPVSRAPVPVLSVGSVMMGGVGKTPVTRWLAERLLARGTTAGVVCGAYRGSCRGHAKRLGRDDLADPEAVARYGDEAVMLARWLEEGIVTCGRDKLAAAVLAAEHGAEVIVVDDGFQHRRLHRDLEIVVRPDPRGSGVALQTGLAREPASRLSEADLVWYHARHGQTAETTGLEGSHVLSRNRPVTLIDNLGEIVGEPGCLSGVRVFLMAGVAAPEDFFQIVSGLGARVVGRCFVGDHISFGRRHFRRAARAAADLLLCTEKDLVRMGSHPDARQLVALCCDVEVTAGAHRIERGVKQVLSCSA